MPFKELYEIFSSLSFYDEFVQEFNRLNHSDYDLLSYLKTIDAQNWIVEAFSWSMTKSSSQWSKRNYDWTNFVYNHKQDYISSYIKQITSIF